MGVMIPIEVYNAMGIDEHTYHLFAIAGGGVAGLMVVFGLIFMFIRKLSVERVRAHTTFADYFTIVLLFLVAGMGTYLTIIYDLTVVAYEYRVTIGPWFRSLFTFHPKSELMLGIPALFKVHVILAFILFAAIPFTKLVHMFSFPLRYPSRAPQQYRSRNGYNKNSR
jgi:nitrate reductase gamma subunit